ncbi:hypothetical protein FSP39_015222 [Pinctada imbricata]|uniref:C2H2-type domain-containing protein n=1 Tax=Pinctada imbricata TaxID=66713 RepID=A0AA88YKM8_PINIB|nr:hypothetical protein FSP39_015222 [Pinctada imbricata]
MEEDREHQDEESGENYAYACPEQTCTKAFTKSHFLEAHICRGNHAFPKIENSYDKVKLIWADQCMAVDGGHKLLIQSTSTISLPLNEGWALKSIKPSKRFTKNVKDYLILIYLDCKESGKRPNFDQLSKELKLSRNEDGAKTFTRDEWLSASQISSLFANFVKIGSTSAAKGDQDEDLQLVVRDLETLEFQSNISQLVSDIVSTC